MGRGAGEGERRFARGDVRRCETGIGGRGGGKGRRGPYWYFHFLFILCMHI